MRVLMFKPCFVSAVADMEKTQTIRKNANCKYGDTLSLRHWAGKPYRSKHVVIDEAFCSNVKPVVIDNSGVAVNGEKLDAAESAVFALADGFDTEDEMVDFFRSEYGLPFSGDLIEWVFPPRHCWEELDEDEECLKTGCNEYDVAKHQNCWEADYRKNLRRGAV